jgi:hypothetical protein
VSHEPDDIVVPFARFLDAQERRRRVAAAFKQPTLSQLPDDSPPTAAVAVALAREAVSATSRSGFLDETTTATWIPPESPDRGSY